MAAKEESDYSEMGRGDLEKIAEKLHKMDHGERAKHTAHALKGFHESGVMDAEYNVPYHELTAGKKAKAMHDLYTTLHNDHQKKKKDLEHTVVSSWLKKFADKIMPAMHVGAENHPLENYHSLVMYLEEFDAYQKRLGKESDIMSEIRGEVKKGRGASATIKIIEAINLVKRSKDLNQFMELLIPPDHYEFRDAAAKTIADDTAKHLSPADKKRYKLSIPKISQNLPLVFQYYSRHDYASIIEKTREDIEKKGK